MQLFIDEEEGPFKIAHYLFFPTIDVEGHRVALFVTYMPGPIHCTVDAKFHANTMLFLCSSSEGWRRALTTVTKFLNKQRPQRRSAGPSFSLSRSSGTRMAMTLTWLTNSCPTLGCIGNILSNIVELRQYGDNLMRRTAYRRLFLGVSISKPNDVDPYLYEEAIVLWGQQIKSSRLLNLGLRTFVMKRNMATAKIVKKAFPELAKMRGADPRMPVPFLW